MTDLKVIGYSNVQPQLERLSWVDVDIRLSRHLDEFDALVARKRQVSVGLVAGTDSITISVPVEHFKDNVIELDAVLRDVSDDAATMRKLHASALERVKAQAAEIDW